MLHCSWHVSSGAIVQSTTSKTTSSTESLSLSAPLGALLHRPFRYLDHHQQRAMSPMECLHHLRIKTLPSHQDARARGMTCHAGHPRTKKEAAKKSLSRKKTLLHSQRCHVKTACCLRRRRGGIKIRLRLCGGLR